MMTGLVAAISGPDGDVCAVDVHRRCRAGEAAVGGRVNRRDLGTEGLDQLRRRFRRGAAAGIDHDPQPPRGGGQRPDSGDQRRDVALDSVGDPLGGPLVGPRHLRVLALVVDVEELTPASRGRSPRSQARRCVAISRGQPTFSM